MTLFSARGCHNTTLADMTNTRVIENVDDTLLNNLPLPVMSVAPMQITTSENDCITYTVADEKIMAATIAALETGTLTPLIKEELKCSILTRRFEEGKEDISIDFTVPEKKKLTEEEEARATVRREQNRIAAQRFRQKQKDTSGRLLKKTQRLESNNTQLKAELLRLREEKDRLQELFNDHMLVCPVGYPVMMP